MGAQVLQNKVSDMNYFMVSSSKYYVVRNCNCFEILSSTNLLFCRWCIILMCMMVNMLDRYIEHEGSMINVNMMNVKYS